MRRCKRPGCIYILWGDQFNEVMAALFASELRAAGWRTWLVGLHGAEHAGRYGVTLVADLSLGEALRAEERMACLVAPCALGVITDDHDPRLGELVQKARAQQAVLIVEDEQLTTAMCEHAHNAQARLQELLDRLQREPDSPACAGAHSREGACTVWTQKL